MASFAYISQLLVYDNDDGSQCLRHQKRKIADGTADPLVPSTLLIAARLVNSSNQYEGTSTNLRHLDLVVNGQVEKAVIPYGASEQENLIDSIREILDSPGVMAGRYVGESEDYGDTANNHL